MWGARLGLPWVRPFQLITAVGQAPADAPATARYFMVLVFGYLEDTLGFTPMLNGNVQIKILRKK